jgi:hypothetical protein
VLVVSRPRTLATQEHSTSLRRCQALDALGGHNEWDSVVTWFRQVLHLHTATIPVSEPCHLKLKALPKVNRISTWVHRQAIVPEGKGDRRLREREHVDGLGCMSQLLQYTRFIVRKGLKES